MKNYKKILYTLVLIGIIVLSGIQIAKALPNINILGNYAVVGTGLNSTTTANTNLTASGTIAFVSLGSTGNPCLTIGTDGKIATSTCGGSTFTTTTITAAGTTLSKTAYIFATSSETNLGLTIGALIDTLTWTPTWIGTLADSRITSASNWNSKATSTLTLTAGAGLTGGGDLTADRTFTIGQGTNIVVNADDVAVTSTPSFTTLWTNTLNATSATIGTINITSLAQSPLVVGGTATTTIYGNGSESTFGGGISATYTSSTNANFVNTTTTNLFFNDNTKQTTAFKNIGFTVINATSTDTASSTPQKLFYQAMTITQIDCGTSGANITISADERASSTRKTAGTEVFNGTSLVCDADGNSTSTFANATIATNAVLNFDLDTLANSTTTLWVDIKFREQ